MARLSGRAVDVSPGLIQPSGHVRITSDLNEPSKQREAISAPQSETCSEGGQDIGECTRVVIPGPDSISHHIGHSLGIFLVVQEVSRNPRRPGNRQAGQHDPLPLPNCSLVKPDVGSAGLPSARQREIMPIRRKMTQAVEGCGRAVRYNALLRRPLPRRDCRRQLKPGRPEGQVIRQRRPRKPVYPMSYPVEHSAIGQPLQRSLRDTGQRSLPPGHQTPLVFGNPRDPASSR